ncbi:hypothetical protein D9M69_567420 [compost metagenome]
MAVGLLQAAPAGRPDDACQALRLTTGQVAARTYLSRAVWAMGASEAAFSVGANSFAMGSAAAPWYVAGQPCGLLSE